MAENTLSVLQIASGLYPLQVEIDNDLKALQQAAAELPGKVRHKEQERRL